MTFTIPQFWAGVACTIIAQMLVIVVWAIVLAIRKPPVWADTSEIVAGGMRAWPEKGHKPSQAERDHVEKTLTGHESGSCGLVVPRGWCVEVVWPGPD